MALIETIEYPKHLYYDLDNQIWYDLLEDGTVRVGFTPISMRLMGDVLAFTPKRVGKAFEAHRSFATIEGGKWVGAAEAAFSGIVIASNDELVRRPRLLNEDAFGAGWMLIVRPDEQDWKGGLITGSDVGPAFEAWIGTEAYKDRVG